MAQSANTPPPSAAERTPFDLVVIVASAGGLDAISAVLRELPATLPAAVLVGQHLGAKGSALVDILARRSALPVRWIDDGARLQPGHVYTCPPRSGVEVLPDGTCSLVPQDRRLRPKMLDSLLEAVADSYGPRALAVVLTGMGRDGARGALALKQAGGTVLVQSADTAEQPSMPRAAVDVGAADLVLPLHAIGQVVATVMAGGRLPLPPTEREAARALFTGPGEIPGLLRAIDWSQTPLGAVTGWPEALRTAARLVLSSPMGTILLWGDEHVQLYNDHLLTLMGARHPQALGQPNRECWPEVWRLSEPIYRRVRQGEPVALRDALFPMMRDGALQNAWLDLFYAPVYGEGGRVDGILATILETTTRVLASRRISTLHALATGSAGARSAQEAMARALATLAENADDVPFAVGYLLDALASRATLAAATGVEPGSAAAPYTIELRGGHPAWPIAAVARGGAPLLLDDLQARFRGLHTGSWAEATTSALLLPLHGAGDEPPTGVLVAGISPRLPFDALSTARSSIS